MKVTIERTELRTEDRIVKEKTVKYGARIVHTKVVETTTEPYVVFSCGHVRREIDFRAQNRGRTPKTTTCYECNREKTEQKAQEF